MFVLKQIEPSKVLGYLNCSIERAIQIARDKSNKGYKIQLFSKEGRIIADYSESLLEKTAIHNKLNMQKESELSKLKKKVEYIQTVSEVRNNLLEAGIDGEYVKKLFPSILD